MLFMIKYLFVLLLSILDHSGLAVFVIPKHYFNNVLSERVRVRAMS